MRAVLAEIKTLYNTNKVSDAHCQVATTAAEYIKMKVHCQDWTQLSLLVFLDGAMGVNIGRPAGSNKAKV